MADKGVKDTICWLKCSGMGINVKKLVVQIGGPDKVVHKIYKTLKSKTCVIKNIECLGICTPLFATDLFFL